MNILELKNVTKSYGNVHALKDFDLSVAPGEWVSIMGPSGSGKSTMLNIIGCMDKPTSGSVSIDGIEVTARSNKELTEVRREKIGLVFQQFHLIPHLTALENVMLPLAITGKPNREQTEMAIAVLEKVGLAKKENRLPNQLSGGEQERVAIARAIVNEPPILFADEPTGALDSKNSEEIMNLFKDLNTEGQTIIMVTHNQEFLTYVKRAVFIRDGLLDDNQHVKKLAV